jgi:hypothetical protein
MTEDQQIILMIKGAISELPIELREQVALAYDEIKAIEAKYPGDAGVVAISLRGSELAAAADD